MFKFPIDAAKADQVPASLKVWRDATGKGPKQLVNELSGVTAPLGWHAKLMKLGYC